MTPTKTFQLAGREVNSKVNRMGYGAMQLAGPGVFGPPKDHGEAIAVLREAVASGINHIDTSDFYGPHVTNQLIKEALYPYPEDLVIVTKIGAVRGEDASWIPAQEPDDLKRAVEDNLKNLGLEAMDVVNLRIMGDGHGPTEGSIAKQFSTMLDLQKQGHIKHIGLSTVTPTQIKEAQSMGEIVCVQNQYNIVDRNDDAMIDDLAAQGIAYVPYFPLGSKQNKWSPTQTAALSEIAAEVGEAVGKSITPMQVALAWLLYRSPNILLIPGTSSREHLRENIAAGELELSEEVLEKLNTI